MKTNTTKTETGNIEFNSELRKGNYTVLSTFHLKDNRLNISEKGLLTILLTLPKNWTIKKSKMSQYLGIDRNTFKKMLNHLINLGYVQTEKLNTNNETYKINSISTEQKEFNIYNLKQYTRNQLEFFLNNDATPNKYKKVIKFYLDKDKELEKYINELLQEKDNEIF